MVKLFYIMAALLCAWALVDLGLAKQDAGAAYVRLEPEISSPQEGTVKDVSVKKDHTEKAALPLQQLPLQQLPQAALPPMPAPAPIETPVSSPSFTKVASAAPVRANVCPAPRAGSPSSITHFGQPLRLNGANLAWSRDAHYARDVGTDYVDIAAFRQRFAQIAAAGGNSARWWMHTNGTTTPHIDPMGRVLGLSSQQSNAQVVGQVRAILDAAWAEGIVLNITLFSFDFMCQRDRLGAHSAMLTNQSDSYMNNALAPLVRGLKDHPALFAWEIFNEAEGMSVGTSFFSDPSLQNCAVGKEMPTRVFQRFVNHAAARIHAIDPNVKVTTSVGHPRHLKDYTNARLMGQDFSRRGGLLDFYQIHWYSEDYNPFEKTSASYNLDRPIVVGEYGASGSRNARRLLKNGYAGAWMWALTSESPATAAATIQSGQVCAPPINKAAIEGCIASRSPTCYK